MVQLRSLGYGPSENRSLHRQFTSTLSLRRSPIYPIAPSHSNPAYNISNSSQRLQPVHIWPFDAAWGPSALDIQTINQTLPPNLFAFSIIPYAGFLYHLTRSKQAPPMTLFGFYFLLVFVFATIPAGIYAKVVYHTSLANVDWLHGSAEALLTVTNLFIVIGLRQAIKEAEAAKQEQQDS